MMTQKHMWKFQNQYKNGSSPQRKQTNLQNKYKNENRKKVLDNGSGPSLQGGLTLELQPN